MTNFDSVTVFKPASDYWMTSEREVTRATIVAFQLDSGTGRFGY